MTPADLERFEQTLRKERGWGRYDIIKALDVSHRRYVAMLHGDSPIRRHIALACSAIASGLDPYGG